MELQGAKYEQFKLNGQFPHLQGDGHFPAYF